MSTADPPPSLRPPSDQLLRTMAAVPVSSSILLLGCNAGQHAHPLLRLGFPVHACDPRPQAVQDTRQAVASLLGNDEAETCVREGDLPTLELPDETFNWVVVYRAEVWGDEAETFRTLLVEARRVLKPGGWCYVSVPAQEGDLDADAQTSANGQWTADADADAPLFSMAALDTHRSEAGFAEAEAPRIVRETDGPRIHAIFRHVVRGSS